MYITLYASFLILFFIFFKNKKIKLPENSHKKDPTIDFVKVLATIFVVTVHQFGDIGYYDQNLNRFTMILSSVFFEIVLTGVPIFLIISGFLLYKKEATKQYYFNIFYFLIPASIGIFVANIFWAVHEQSLLVFLKPLPYYVPLYTVLYLIAPFINLILKKVSKKGILCLLCLLILVIISPDLLLLNWDYPLLYIHRKIARLTYPIMYYTLGALIHKFDFKVGTKKLILIALITISVTVYEKFILLFNQNPSYIFGYYNGLPTMLLAVVVFLLSRNINFKSSMQREFFLKFSKLSLYFYLLSNVSGRLINEFIVSHMSYNLNFFEMPLWVVLIIASSYPVIIICYSLSGSVTTYLKEKTSQKNNI
ncbi:acyltransferase [Carnobacterium maltaromaticum]|uniref:acyltransferase n=1 Tax=Carnobacterium maltaromaticum TaxID=2751 RepID=UPI001DC2FC92|nr:acyltransferase family protein [Carnobacterium maltaromaticum]MCC4313178.1 hypothetical protein [Carnobacterium maltaromaticum]